MVADLNSKVAFQNVNTHCTAQLSSPSLLKERGGVREEEEEEEERRRKRRRRGQWNRKERADVVLTRHLSLMRPHH